MKILGILSESTLFRSRSAIERFTARQAADLFHMHVSALTLLRESPFTSTWAKDYAKRTLNYGSFSEWHSNSTDFGILGWSLFTDECEFRLASTSSRLRERLTVDEGLMTRWLRSVSSTHMDEGTTKRIFSRIDTWLRIEDEALRAIRRLVQDWNDLSTDEASLALTRLLQLFRAHAENAEILPELEKLAKHHGLELRNVCNPETGEGCGRRDEHEPVSKKKGNLFAQMASVAAGAAIGYKLSANRHVKEDATAGATCAGDIAALAIPFGATQRRVMPTTIAIPNERDVKRRASKKKPK